MRLGDSVQFLKGVGPRKAALLEAAGISTLEDLLFHLPFRYEDRRSIVSVGRAEVGREATLVGSIGSAREIRARGRRGRVILNAVFQDESGRLALVWFHQAAFFKKKLAEASLWLVHGKVERGRRGGLEIVPPEIDALSAAEAEHPPARILPVYQKPGEMTVAAMRSMVVRAREACGDQARSIVPPSVAQRVGLMPIRAALERVHAPAADANVDALNESRTDAHRTLIFEELFALQVGMLLRRAQREHTRGTSMPEVPDLVARFVTGLGFRLTDAQRRVMAEVAADMAAPRPMNRLVQGDVGSGKTVVAFAAVVQAASAGYQSAVMAPTELLAEQHHATMADWAQRAGIRIALLGGTLAAAEARKVREHLAEGSIDLVVGTHALIQESTRFARLGLAIIDEQHRFGVMQRAALKGSAADTLLLSATPIPRTLSLVLFGDLDVSLLDEMPPGRKPVTTRVLRSSARARLYERMAAAMSEGRQCYIVYPLVEESEAIDVADATSMAERLAAGPFRRFRVGLLHGRMKGDEKDAVMRRFKRGEIDVLVATTVIEVGIDVPNAAIMVIEHPERFGLAQLHQLRGRVGRGGGDAYCCLVAEPGLSPEAFERLRVMETTSDGFAVAEADLKLRGPGEYLGTRQSGAPALRAANLVRDVALLERARTEALDWLRRDPRLRTTESAALLHALERRWGERLTLAEVG